MQKASFRIWTLIANSISYDNYYTNHASFHFIKIYVAIPY